MRKITALWRLARPAQVLAVALVFILGLLGARATGAPLDTPALLWASGIALLLTVAIHYVNEYADVETDALTERTPYSGGSGVLPLGIIPRYAVLFAALGLTLISLVMQIVTVLAGIHAVSMMLTWVVIAFGGWAYSLPPVALSWRGWGEIDNALLGGLVMPIYGYLSQTPQLEPVFIAACIPFVMLTFVNLLATTWPDRFADAAVGKYTLVTRFTPDVLRKAFITITAAAYVVLVMTGFFGVPLPVRLGGLAAAPLSLWAVVVYTKQENPAPAVWAMVTMLLGILVGWWVTGSFT